MMHDELLALLAAHRPALAGAAARLRDELAAHLATDARLKLHSVTVRTKAPDSVAAKLARPDRTYARLWDVTDLVGLRVITYFEDGVDRVAELVEAHLPIDLRHSVDKRRAHGRFGYRSLHYVCELRDPALPPEARFEIQVRTILEHAWAEIEHDLGYKARIGVPAPARRRLDRLAGMLELVDQEFVAIRGELAAYEHSLRERIAAADAVPLDRLSLLELMACDEVRALDAAIAEAIGRPLGDDPFFPDYLLRMLGFGGLVDVAEVRACLGRHRTAIVAMVAPYFAFASSAWRLSPENMDRIPRGYALFFLAHAVVLESSRLGVTKVERLARLYRELDYPDDERAAHDVASRLVMSLG
ncbi:MAG: GTP pyrophosphokinase family protein [Deltaproteobacteria bacterium]|nr:GTP pyrophosphokinase family protein [Deltaproteobacteria bacterium]